MRFYQHQSILTEYIIGRNSLLGTGHTASILGSRHTASILGTGHAASILGTIHTSSILGTIHTASILSTGHTASILGTIHTASTLGTGHAASILGTRHNASVLGTRHIASILGTGHTPSILGAGHTASILGQYQYTLKVHSTHSTSSIDFQIDIPISFGRPLRFSFLGHNRLPIINGWWAFRIFSAARNVLRLYLAPANVRNNASRGENLVCCTATGEYCHHLQCDGSCEREAVRVASCPVRMPGNSLQRSSDKKRLAPLPTERLGLLPSCSRYDNVSVMLCSHSYVFVHFAL